MSNLKQSDIAAHLDMSTRNLRDVLNQLGLDAKKSSLEEIRTAYIRKLRNEAAGRSDKDLGQVRARKEEIQAKREELAYSRDLGLIVAAEHLEPLLTGLVKSIQMNILQAGGKIISALETEHDITLDDDAIYGHLRSALGNIAGGADQLVSRLSSGPSASVSSAVDAHTGVDREAL